MGRASLLLAFGFRMSSKIRSAVCLAFFTALPLFAQSDEIRFPFGLGEDQPGAASERPIDGAPEEPPPVAPVAHKRFLAAAGELLLLEVGPWAFDRYVLDEDFARISFHTIKKNFQTGFHYDSDTFTVNQSSHPYHGSLFFMAARSNGYGFWESGAFALTGSLLWECCMENTAPSVNDLVNTTLGGMTRGEVSHRLSAMIRDNTANGSGRIWRELGAAVLDPFGAVTRLANGDWKREYPNPDDRFPSRVAVTGDLGYRHVADGGVTPDQGIVSLSAFYGDPFAGEIVHPFDTFWAGIDLNTPGSPYVSRIEERGILKGWELTDASDPVRHIVGFSQEYEYFNNASQVFGAEMFSGGALSRYRLGSQYQAMTDAGALVIPLAGIRTTDFANPQTGRNYDYGVGGGARVAARLFRGGREIAAAGYAVAWTHTVNGVSDGNTLQSFRSSLRVPVAGPIGVGGGYSWYSRKTTYSQFFEARKTQSDWRAFVDFAYATH
jgi:hypothetical protein